MATSQVRQSLVAHMASRTFLSLVENGRAGVVAADLIGVGEELSTTLVDALLGFCLSHCNDVSGRRRREGCETIRFGMQIAVQQRRETKMSKRPGQRGTRPLCDPQEDRKAANGRWLAVGSQTNNWAACWQT